MFNVDKMLTQGQIASGLAIIAFLLFMIFLAKYPDNPSKKTH